jgi:hypothetical protein
MSELLGGMSRLELVTCVGIGTRHPGPSRDKPVVPLVGLAVCPMIHLRFWTTFSEKDGRSRALFAFREGVPPEELDAPWLTATGRLSIPLVCISLHHRLPLPFSILSQIEM